MKIIHLLSDNTHGPAVRMATDLCRAASAEGHSAMVMCRKERKVTESLDEAGVEWTSAPMKGAVDVLTPVKLSKVLREAPQGRTVIHAHRLADAVIASRARVLAKRDDVKIVLTRHVVAPAPVDLASTRVYADIDVMVFPTAVGRDTFLSTGPKTAGMDLEIIPSATMMPATSHGPVAVRDSDMFTVLIAGEITSAKGLETIVDAMADSKSKKMRVVVLGTGPGPVVMPVIRQSRRRGVADKIDWKGDAGVLTDLIGAADVMLFPEKAVELQGEAYAVACAAGVPVVASDLPLHRDIFGDSATYFVAGNSASLAEALRQSAKPAEGDDDAARRFSRFVAAHNDLYLKILQTGKR